MTVEYTHLFAYISESNLLCLDNITQSKTHTEHSSTRNKSCYQNSNCHSTDTYMSHVLIFCVCVVACIVRFAVHFTDP
jgi:hypothetical protein